MVMGPLGPIANFYTRPTDYDLYPTSQSATGAPQPVARVAMPGVQADAPPAGGPLAPAGGTSLPGVTFSRQTSPDAANPNATYANPRAARRAMPTGGGAPGNGVQSQGGVKECQTCKKRTYKDVSGDSGVSFQNPTNVSPAQAASAVAGHEQEHVIRERDKAQSEGREIVYQNVQIHTATCSECGKIFVSGGTTVTATRSKPHPNPDLSSGNRLNALA